MKADGIALCISGQARISEQTKKSLIDFILKPLRDEFSQVDVHVHFWRNVYIGEKKKWSEGEKVDADVIDFWSREVGVTTLKVEEPINFFEREIKIRTPLAEAPTYESQHVSIEHVQKSMRDAEAQRGRQYKFLIKTRADLLYRNPIRPEWLHRYHNRLIIPDREGHKWVGETPPEPWQRSDWLPDQFWAGSRDAIDFLMGFRSAFNDRLLTPGRTNNIERLLFRYFRPYKTRWMIQRVPLLYRIENTPNNR
jgi:hypothetical protein